MLDFGFYNMDCMDGMKQFPDKYFDLAIVDPPYGGGASQNVHVERERESGLHGGVADYESRKRSRFGGWFDCYYIGGPDGRRMDETLPKGTTGAEGADLRHWDIAPPPEYFNELARVSKNQIIWGGNYFDLPPTRCFLVWRKATISENFSMAMAEYAWTSFNENAKVFERAPQDPGRFHPTQKPVELYLWTLNLFAKPGDKILDTHAGSASSLVACHRLGFQYVGFEIEPAYYEKARDRLEREQAQMSLFE